jgi:CheY-like chemotaxis protein
LVAVSKGINILFVALNALLLSEDPDVVQVLRPLLPELGITTDQCSYPDAAMRLLSSRKYEAVIVDDEILGGIEFMGSLRQLPMTRNAIIFGLVRFVSVTVAFQCGANFVLEKPLTVERAQRSFRAAQGLILRERRRYFRHPVNFSAYLECGSDINVVLVTNLSEGGMAVESGSPLTPGIMVKFKFDLPQGRSIEGRGEISWTDTTGKAGVCFLFVPFAYKLKLEEWLNDRASEEPVTSMLLNVNSSWTTD